MDDIAQVAPPPVALTIAGTDPSGGAGVAADLRAFQAAGVAGASVVTAVVAQNTQGVRGIHIVPPRFVARQMDAVAEDMPVAATKIGMLANAQIVSVVAGRVRRRRLPNVVLDPVLAASDGTPLLAPKAVDRLRAELLPLALVVTPNLDEAKILSKTCIETLEDARKAAEIIYGFGPRYVIVKGGHWGDEAPSLDLLFDGTDFTILTEPRVRGRSVRGTGCLFSASLAAHLARGLGVEESAARAKQFVTHAIETAALIGKGSRVWAGEIGRLEVPKGG
jgi:hydroxymethylpyrimidine/phosphomethylpyrimidine kinase